ncbi:IS110 family transposase [Agrococcus sp. Ld7]|uniref:IS110 family transposase n=1 Tax=Agrococcus sp. Ld7 TaxID=649148 RepID=UPI00386FB7E4
MPIVAEAFTHVIGVDTHAAKHAYAIVDAATGGLVAERTFPTSQAGIARAITWIRRRGGARIAVAVEGSGSYGAQLTRALQREGLPVFEVRPPGRGSRARDGKTDQFDAIAAARAILHADLHRLATPRAEGVRAALHVLAAARRALKQESNRAKQQLIALLRTHPLGIDARESIANTTVDQVAAWRPRKDDTVELAFAREEAIRLARRIIPIRAEMAANERHLRDLVAQLVPTVLELPGVGPVSAATILDTYSHPGRIHSADAFARMAGAAPLPVQSGKSGHHRLNRGQNRALNEALYVIVKHRLMNDPDTIAYAARRTSQGKGAKDIQRILKRYVARAIFRHLETAMA